MWHCVGDGPLPTHMLASTDASYESLVNNIEHQRLSDQLYCTNTCLSVQMLQWDFEPVTGGFIDVLKALRCVYITWVCTWTKCLLSFLKFFLYEVSGISFVYLHSLTNEESRKNWETYGNPDGPRGEQPNLFPVHTYTWISLSHSANFCISFFPLCPCLNLHLPSHEFWNCSTCMDRRPEKLYVGTVSLISSVQNQFSTISWNNIVMSHICNRQNVLCYWPLYVFCRCYWCMVWHLWSFFQWLWWDACFITWITLKCFLLILVFNYWVGPCTYIWTVRADSK